MGRQRRRDRRSFSCNFLTPPFVLKSRKILLPPTKQIVKHTIQNLIVQQELTTTATSLIITTPGIHKLNNPGRPIVSACMRPTELFPSYVDKIMAPIMYSLPSCINYSHHALSNFRDFNFPGEDKLIFIAMFSLCTLRLYSPSFRRAKVLKLISIFPINALWRW